MMRRRQRALFEVAHLEWEMRVALGVGTVIERASAEPDAARREAPGCCSEKKEGAIHDRDR